MISGVIHPYFEDDGLCISLSLCQVTAGEYQEEKDHAPEIDQVAGVDDPTAAVAVMKIDSQHFYIIIGARRKNRQSAHSRKTAVDQKTKKSRPDKCHHGIIGDAAAEDPDGSEDRR